MEYRTLELNVLSATDLKKVNLFSSMEVYVVVSLHGSGTLAVTKQKTPISKQGGRNPYWNHTMKFTIDDSAAQQNNLMLVFEILCRQNLGPDKLVGDVHVPVKDLLSSAGNTQTAQFVSYQVRKPSGKPKGVLAFSFKLSEGNTADEPVTAYAAVVPGSSAVYSPQGQYPPPKADYRYAEQYPPPPPPTAPVAYPAEGYKYGYGGYPPQATGVPGYAYSGPQNYGYGYGPYGYGSGYNGYPAGQQSRPNRNNFGLGVGAGLLGGALAGLLVGDLVSDAVGFDGGFDPGFGGGFDMGGF
ncbi:hypothetical protein Ancab_030564 [Ancistrocladus abbreviatus]